LSDPTTSASPPPGLAEALARLDRLEATVADQDRVLEDLNGVVLDQWKLIEELKRRTAMLTDQLLEMESRSGLRGAPEPPPPHW
jgi:SlyX protein